MSKSIILALVGILCCLALALIPGCVVTKTTQAVVTSPEYGNATIDRTVSVDTGTQAAE